MGPRGSFVRLIGSVLMLALVVASAQPLTAPAAESEAYVVATSAEQVVGTWHAGNHYVRFAADGVLLHAVGRDALDTRPYVTDAYRFEDGVMVVAELSCWSTIPCHETVGRYEVRLLEGGMLRIVEIEDRCRHRAGDMVWAYALVERIATSIEQVVGTWAAQTGAAVVRLDRDSLLRAAWGSGLLESAPYAINAVRFEDGFMLVTEREVTGVPSCGDAVGRYKVWQLEGGHLRVFAIDDPCDARASDMTREYLRFE